VSASPGFTRRRASHPYSRRPRIAWSAGLRPGRERRKSISAAPNSLTGQSVAFVPNQDCWKG
jgi:hypothetical protein